MLKLTCYWCKKEFERSRKKNDRSFCCRQCFNEYSKDLQEDNLTTIRHMYGKAKSRAKRENIEFDLQLEDINNLWNNQDSICALTGEHLVFGKTNHEKKHGYNTASLDRKDSSLGYIPNNIQIIHKIINQMKFNLNEEEFIYWCRRVAEQNPTRGLDRFVSVGYNDGVSEANETPF